MDVTMFILKGSLITAELFFITAVFSVPLGCMVAIGKISKIKPLRALLGLYTWAFRGTPLLFCYFLLILVFL
jgi:polar amino acid transport system permease protein